MTTANLCRCNNCNWILIDQNPQVGAREYQLTGNECEMQYLENEGAWVCPNCETDDYLTDDLNGEYLPVNE